MFSWWINRKIDRCESEWAEMKIMNTKGEIKREKKIEENERLTFIAFLLKSLDNESIWVVKMFACVCVCVWVCAKNHLHHRLIPAKAIKGINFCWNHYNLQTFAIGIKSHLNKNPNSFVRSPTPYHSLLLSFSTCSTRLQFTCDSKNGKPKFWASRNIKHILSIL